MDGKRSRLTGLERLRVLREVSESTGEDMANARGRFERLADPASAPRVVSSFNLFQTPEPLAAQLAGMFGKFGRTLEPSAGLGRLYRAVRRLSSCRIVLVDNSPECCRELYIATAGDGGARLVQRDFLACQPSDLGYFDSIIMNPPFKNGADIRHIQHARTFLAPGGRLAAICANGPKQRSALMPLAGAWHDLPPGSFKGEGTNVNAAIVVFD